MNKPRTAYIKNHRTGELIERLVIQEGMTPEQFCLACRNRVHSEKWILISMEKNSELYAWIFEVDNIQAKTGY